MAAFSFIRLAGTVVVLLVLTACTVQPPANVGDKIDTLVQTASGIVQDAKDTAKDLQNRAQNAQKGIKELASGATLLQNSLKPRY